MINFRHFSRIQLALTAVALLALSGTGASAQGLFDMFRPQRAEPPAQTLAYADPSPATPRAPASHATSHVATNSGRTVAYCVRLCDGRHFPIQVHGAANAVQLCNSFCPAAETKVFTGSNDISRAVAKDGTRYSMLENAFLYRKRIVSDCTCNGKDSFGVAAVDIKDDPTMRKGDIVASSDTPATATR
jgi:uncharacterized protein DUF2865